MCKFHEKPTFQNGYEQRTANIHNSKQQNCRTDEKNYLPSIKLYSIRMNIATIKE